MYSRTRPHSRAEHKGCGLIEGLIRGAAQILSRLEYQGLQRLDAFVHLLQQVDAGLLAEEPNGHYRRGLPRQQLGPGLDLACVEVATRIAPPDLVGDPIRRISVLARLLSQTANAV